MKPLICEMCCCTDLEREGNKYICTACGTEYVDEEEQASEDDIEIYDFTCDTNSKYCFRHK